MQTRMGGVVERFRFGAYGLVVGLLVGMVLGWWFHRIVGTVLWILLIVVILAPFVAAVIFWQRISSRNRVERTGNDGGLDAVTVHEGRRVRDAGTVRDDALDAEWRERP